MTTATRLDFTDSAEYTPPHPLHSLKWIFYLTLSWLNRFLQIYIHSFAMGLFYELHKHHYGCDGGPNFHPTEAFYGRTTETASCSDDETQNVFERAQDLMKETVQTVHNGLVEVGIVFDCFGQEVEEKLKAIAEIWGWSGTRTCHNRYVNVPIAACILILSGASGLAYAMACGLLFPPRSLPARKFDQLETNVLVKY